MGSSSGRPARKRLRSANTEAAPLAHVLCLAGSDTTAAVQQVAASAALSVRPVSTTAEALWLLDEQRKRQRTTDDASSAGGFRALVAALGVNPSNFLFNAGYGDRSDLISRAKQLGCIVVVYSYTAVRDRDISRACMDVGAHAVVASVAGLQQQLAMFAQSDAIEAAELTPRMDPDSASAARATPCVTTVASSQLPAGGRVLPVLPAGAVDNSAELRCYPPLLRRVHRDQAIISQLGDQLGKVARIRQRTQSIARSLASLPRPLLASHSDNSHCFARVVAISDTHS